MYTPGLIWLKSVNWLKSVIKRDEGVTAIEYGLIAALIAVIIIAAITLVGQQLEITFNKISDALVNANKS